MNEPGGQDAHQRAVIMRAFGCAEELADVVAHKAHVRHHPPRAAIVRAEDRAVQVHLVIDGHARMVAIAAEGRASVIEDYADGDLFGERGLFGEAVVPHDVIAVRASRIGAFANADFLGLMAHYSAIAMAVSRILVARLDLAQRRLAEGATLSARGRICAELLRAARDGTAMTIRPAPVLARLATAVDSTRETVSRTIGDLERRGIIVREDDGLRVIAPHRLEELIV